MTLPFDAQLRQARLAHLGYWLCFGAGAGFIATAPREPFLALAVVVLAIGALIAICLDGLYRSWDAMTAYEQ